MIVLAACVCVRFVRGNWPPAILLIAAGVVLLLRPIDYAALRAQSAPTGLWVLAGSFLLFALGTLLALNRSKWSHPAARISPTTRVEPNH